VLIEWLAEIKNNVNEHGIRWGLALSLYALFRKERRNLLLDKRDEAIFHNLRVIMEHLGVGEQWHGPVKILRNEEVQSLKRLYLLLQMEIQQVYQKRRKKKMKLLLTNPWSKKLFAFLLLIAVNGLNDVLGLHLTADTISRITSLGGTYIVAQAGVDAIKPIILYVVGLIENKSVSTPAQPVQSDPNKFIAG
jgi:hypothetical protein